MNKIRILPDILSNQIAAGEVVQRPASVVKELLENSIDAGCSQVMVEIEKGGKSLIRVSDDGQGLVRDQALLAIERYATSKLHDQKDLFAISSFGFRGEALPSIASVSKFNLITRPDGENIGTSITLNGGKLIDVSEVGAPKGTMIQVKNLFFNTPARRKFLKTDNTETSHIADVISGMALGNTGIACKLIINGKLSKHFPPTNDIVQRALSVLGKETVGSLYYLQAESQNIRVTGACAHPAMTRSTSSRLYLFVNGRLIYDRGLLAAVFKGYEGRIMKGRFPMGSIYVDLPFDQVDVNVHPAKREIKFLDPGAVYRVVTSALEQAMQKAQKQHSKYAQTNLEKAFAPSDFSTSKFYQEQDQVQETQAPGKFYQDRNSSLPKISSNFDALKYKKSKYLPWGESPVEPLFEKLGNIQSIGENKVESPASFPEPGNVQDMDILGQVLGTYIVAESTDFLVLVDQHAAHERIVYESLKKRHDNLDIQSQALLVPQTLELGFREADLLSGVLDKLSAMGLVIEPFGDATFMIRSVPVLVEDKNLKNLVLEIVDSLVETGSASFQWQEDCLISMACHRAIRANKSMNHEEMKELIDQLFRCKNPFHCPHGRPSILFFSASQIEKMFKRVL